MKKFILLIIFMIFISPISINITDLSPDLYINTASALSIGECDYITSMGTCVANGILTVYELIIFYTTQILLVIVGLMFDAFLFFSLNSNFYRSGIIEAGWEILRDFTNIIFIFALLTIAFKLVLNQDDGKTKSTLIKTILIALTINFSLFITYAIIDSSNILAQVFYNRIDATGAYNVDNTNQSGEAGPASASPITNWVADLTDGQKSVSLAVASKINPQAIIQQSGVDNFIQGFIIVTSAGAMNILLGYIFITLMLLFLGRSLGLMISAIIAPIAFASLTVPSMQGLPYVGFNTWLKELIKLAFMAPVFMFFMYLIVTFLRNEGFLASLSNVQGQGFLVVIMSTYMFFMIIGGLLLVAKKITTSMAGELGSIAVKGVQGVTGALVAGAAIAATGGAAAAGGLMKVGSKVGGIGAKEGSKRALRAERWSKRGTKALSFKADVTKMPGFSAIAGKDNAKMIGKVTGKSALGHIRDQKKKAADNPIFSNEAGKFAKEDEQKELKDAKDAADKARKDAEAKHEAQLFEAQRNMASSQADPAYIAAMQKIDTAASALTAVEKSEKDALTKLNQLKASGAGAGVIQQATLDHAAAQTDVQNAKQQAQQAQTDLESTKGYQDGKNVETIISNKKKDGDAAEKKSRVSSASQSKDPATANKIIGGKGPKDKALKKAEELLKKLDES